MGGGGSPSRTGGANPADLITQVGRFDDRPGGPKPRSSSRPATTRGMANIRSGSASTTRSGSASATRRGVGYSTPRSPPRGAGLSAGQQSLLPAPLPMHANMHTLVLDLDETLVHSSFKPVQGADCILPIELDGVLHHVYVNKRPYVDEFLRRVSQHFEVVFFTASLGVYAHAVIDELMKPQPVSFPHHRLFREHCTKMEGLYVKDLSLMGRELRHQIIIDNSPTSFLFQPDNSILSKSWFDDPNDCELLQMLMVLDQIARVRKSDPAGVLPLLSQYRNSAKKDVYGGGY